MGYPIKRTITVVWDGADWRNEETGVLVTGVLPPFPSPYPIDEPELKHPFDKSFTVTYEQVQKMIADAIEQYKEEEYNSHYPYATEEKVACLIRDAFEQRTYITPYFWPPLQEDLSDRLIRQRNMVRAIDHAIGSSISEVWKAIRRIDKPWWKRW